MGHSIVRPREPFEWAYAVFRILVEEAGETTCVHRRWSELRKLIESLTTTHGLKASQLPSFQPHAGLRVGPMTLDSEFLDGRVLRMQSCLTIMVSLYGTSITNKTGPPSLRRFLSEGAEPHVSQFACESECKPPEEAVEAELADLADGEVMAPSVGIMAISDGLAACKVEGLNETEAVAEALEEAEAEVEAEAEAEAEAHGMAASVVATAATATTVATAAVAIAATVAATAVGAATLTSAAVAAAVASGAVAASSLTGVGDLSVDLSDTPASAAFFARTGVCVFENSLPKSLVDGCRADFGVTAARVDSALDAQGIGSNGSYVGHEVFFNEVCQRGRERLDIRTGMG